MNPCIGGARGLSLYFSRRCQQNQPRHTNEILNSFCSFPAFKKKKVVFCLLPYRPWMKQRTWSVRKRTFHCGPHPWLCLRQKNSSRATQPHWHAGSYGSLLMSLQSAKSLVDIDCGYIRRVHRFRFCFYGNIFIASKSIYFLWVFFFLYEIICRWYFFNSVL